jgi:hypothetical protein
MNSSAIYYHGFESWESNANAVNFLIYSSRRGARGRVVGWGTVLQSGRSWVWFPIKSLDFFFRWHNPSSRTMALGSTQPPTEMSTRNIPGRPARKSWQPYRHLWADCLEDVGTSTSHNPMGLHGLFYRNSFTLYLYSLRRRINTGTTFVFISLRWNISNCKCICFWMLHRIQVVYK